ncbi:MAG: HDOD domain-containing protein [Planctomycetota bacterium]
MNPRLVQQILDCPALPTLPAVAVRVIEMTSNPDVSFDELAKLIENDQGLSAKILRTVNSSYYALRKPCATIQKAIVLLGLAPVKSLALGFSLIEAVDDAEDDVFPFERYWRRSLFAAVGGKEIGIAINADDPDETFISGLLQDLGMFAIYKGLGQRYLDIMRLAGDDHARLGRMEIELLELSHGEVGTMIGERWKLPRQLLLPIRYHERPSAAPVDGLQNVRSVALANMACDAIDSADPTPMLRRFYAKANDWFKIGPNEADELFNRIVLQTKEAASVFRLKTGKVPDPNDVLRQAERQLIAMQRAEPRQAVSGEALYPNLNGAADRDPITGLMDRAGFEFALTGMTATALVDEADLSLVEFAIEGLGQLERAHSPDVSDEIAIAVAAILNRHFEPLGALSARLSKAVFAVILPGVPVEEAARASGAFVRQIVDSRTRWLPEITGEPPAAEARISAGVAQVETALPDAVMQAVTAAANAVRAARAAGGDVVHLALQSPGDQAAAAA